jgi:hypothetical protein
MRRPYRYGTPAADHPCRARTPAGALVGGSCEHSKLTTTSDEDSAGAPHGSALRAPRRIPRGRWPRRPRRASEPHERVVGLRARDRVVEATRPTGDRLSIDCRFVLSRSADEIVGGSCEHSKLTMTSDEDSAGVPHGSALRAPRRIPRGRWPRRPRRARCAASIQAPRARRGLACARSLRRDDSLPRGTARSAAVPRRRSPPACRDGWTCDMPSTAGEGSTDRASRHRRDGCGDEPRDRAPIDNPASDNDPHHAATRSDARSAGCPASRARAPRLTWTRCVAHRRARARPRMRRPRSARRILPDDLVCTRRTPSSEFEI